MQQQQLQQQQHPMQQQQPQQQRHVQAGVLQEAAVERSPSVGQAQCMDWSEVSYGRNAKY
jgi:hypothetical protein